MGGLMSGAMSNNGAQAEGGAPAGDVPPPTGGGIEALLQA